MKLHFTRNNGPVDAAIDSLMEIAVGIRRPEYIREMIIAALKAGQEDDERADLKLMNTTLKEMRFTSKIFGPYRNVRKVTVFGSARTESDEPVYAMARNFGTKLAESGYMVITGGGGGIMHAVNEGAGPEHSFGRHPSPFEQKPNPVSRATRASLHTNTSSPQGGLSQEADAVALFPAASARRRGHGNAHASRRESATPCHSCSLMSRGHVLDSMDPVPRGRNARAGIYQRVGFLALREGQPGTLSQTYQPFYSRYHSMRYVNKQLVVRHVGPPSYRGSRSDFDILLPQETSCFQDRCLLKPMSRKSPNSRGS
jgi:hypothetical protein